VKKVIKLLKVLDIFIFVPIGIKQHVGLGKWENNPEVSVHKFQGKVPFWEIFVMVEPIMIKIT
jgi:hypothetical protein